MEQIIARINRQLGDDILVPLSRLSDTAVVSTRLPALDSALGISGLPCGYVSAFIGSPTSGATTLAFHIASQIQQQTRTLVLVDAEQTFDPDYAARCGLQVDQLVWLKPDDDVHASTLIRDLLLHQTPDMIVTSHVRQLSVLKPALYATNCVLLIVTHESVEADIVLEFQWMDWLCINGDIRGYQAQVQICRNRFARVSYPITLDITFDGFIDGDAT